MNRIKRIPKELVERCLRFEEPRAKLTETLQKRFEPAFYFDKDVFLTVFEKAMSNEIDVSFFADWCILACKALNESAEFESNKNAKSVLRMLADFFDGCSFDDSYDEMALTNTYAWDKAFCTSFAMTYEYMKQKHPPKKRYLSEGIGRYLIFDYASRAHNGKAVYIALAMDYKNKRFRKAFIDTGLTMPVKSAAYDLFCLKGDKAAKTAFEKIFDIPFDDDSWVEDGGLPLVEEDNKV